MMTCHTQIFAPSTFLDSGNESAKAIYLRDCYISLRGSLQLACVYLP